VEQDGKHRVIHAWAATGQVCDAEGQRCHVEEGEIYFASFDVAKEHCDRVLKKLPFLECHIYSSDGKHLETLVNTKVQGKGFEWNRSLGKYSVRLFEWVSGAALLLDGTYRTEDQEEPILEFSSYREAERHCRLLSKKYPHVECWIYDPDGKIRNRGGTEVRLHESGKYTIKRSWWQRHR
jgi:hypothetical protein